MIKLIIKNNNKEFKITEKTTSTTQVVELEDILFRVVTASTQLETIW